MTIHDTIKCQPISLYSNDAKSCYDRIVLLIAALGLCQLGGTINGLKSMVEMLATMKPYAQHSETKKCN